jgi:hypothetical protein
VACSMAFLAVIFPAQSRNLMFTLTAIPFKLTPICNGQLTLCSTCQIKSWVTFDHATLSQLDPEASACYLCSCCCYCCSFKVFIFSNKYHNISDTETWSLDLFSWSASPRDAKALLTLPEMGTCQRVLTNTFHLSDVYTNIFDTFQLDRCKNELVCCHGCIYFIRGLAY